MISLVGAGGKTSTMYHIISSSEYTLATTTTKIFVPGPKEADVLLLGDEFPEERLSLLLSKGKKVVVGSDVLSGKVLGVPPELVDSLKDKGFSVVVEADGARGYSLKVHRENEPVIPFSTDLVVIVIGMDILGRRAGEDTIFRFRRGIEKGLFEENEKIDVDLILRVVYGRGGYVESIGDFRYAFLLNKVDELHSLEDVIRLAESIVSIDANVYGVYYGSIKRGVVKRYEGSLGICG